MRPERPGGDTWKLLAIFVTLGVGLAIAAVQYQTRLEALNRSEAQSTLLNVAELKAERVASWLQERRSDAALLSGTPAGMSWPTPEEVERLGAWLDAIVREGIYSSAVAVRPNGDIIARQPAAGPADLEFLHERASEVRPGVVVSDLRSDDTGAVHLHLLAPVLDAQGTILATIVLRAELARSILPLFESWPTPSTSAESLLAMRDGDEVVFLSKPRFSSGRLMRRPLTERWLPAVQAVLGHEGFLVGRDYRGVEVLAAAKLVPGTGWAIVTKIDQAEIVTPARLRGWAVLTTGGVLLGLGAVVALTWSRRRDRAAAEQQWLTERRAKEALRASEQQLEATLDSMGDAVLSTDGAGSLVWLNPAAERLLGTSIAQARGQPLTQLFRVVDEQTRQPLESPVAAALQGGDVPGPRRHAALLGPEGRSTPITSTVAPIRDLSGATTGAVVVLRDVTQERTAQRATDSRAKLFLCVSDAVIALGPDRTINDWNPAAERMYGWTEAEARGHGLELLGTEFPLDLSREAFYGTLNATGQARAKVAQRHRDGRRLSVEKAAAVIRDADGSVGGYVVTCRDVTDREQLLTRLVLADRIASASTLAAGVAHEINNPLAIVSGNLAWCRQRLAESNADPVPISAALVEAEDGAARIQRTVVALNTFSQERRAEAATTDVPEAVETAVRMARNQLKHCARLELALDVVPPVVGPQHQLGQVLLNLLLNATQAIPSGAVSENVVKVATYQRPDGLVAIEVSDTGVGIAPDVLPRIFDPFFTTKAFGDGAGLGLPICRGIVSSLGGRIEVDAQRPRGTTFRVLLPIAKDTTRGAAAVAPTLAPVSSGVGRRARVLVVDDEQFICRTILRVLQPHHDAAAVQTGAEALARLQKEPYDVILCDLMMPEMTGMDLHRALPPELASRMVFLTGGAFTPEAQTFLDQQQGRYLLKPFKPKELLETVAEVLGRAGAGASGVQSAIAGTGPGSYTARTPDAPTQKTDVDGSRPHWRRP